MEEKEFKKKLLEELSIIKKLLILTLAQSEKQTLKDKIRFLSNVGLKPMQIAEITNKPVNLIRVMKHSIKSKEDKEDGENK